MNGIIKEIEEYAKINDVPIITLDGIEFIETLIKDNHVKSILEIGSAIGYSSIKMALLDEHIQIDTIERDVERFNIAKSNIEKFNLNKRINIYNIDAFDFISENKYDLIFIDGAKSQYTKWFIQFSKYLNDDGIIVCDNLEFHGHVENYENIESRNLRQLVRKIREFIEFLQNNKEYETKFYDIGDGISVSKKVK